MNRSSMDWRAGGHLRLVRFADVFQARPPQVGQAICVCAGFLVGQSSPVSLLAG